MKVLLIAGARPNFMKIAPIYREALTYNQIKCKIVHTGQHYDYEMSEAFFEDLELPKPDFFLNAGSGSHAVQTAKIMTTFEELCVKEQPDVVIVVGKITGRSCRTCIRYCGSWGHPFDYKLPNMEAKA
jgi:UDP-N-acetylglucosamine 2-epimerase (non-hydrolysing)